jgi:hypothetical protein
MSTMEPKSPLWYVKSPACVEAIERTDKLDENAYQHHKKHIKRENAEVSEALSRIILDNSVTTADLAADR